MKYKATMSQTCSSNTHYLLKQGNVASDLAGVVWLDHFSLQEIGILIEQSIIEQSVGSLVTYIHDFSLDFLGVMPLDFPSLASHMLSHYNCVQAPSKIHQS